MTDEEKEVIYFQIFHILCVTSLCSGCAVASKTSMSDSLKEENIPKFKNSWSDDMLFFLFFLFQDLSNTILSIDLFSFKYLKF